MQRAHVLAGEMGTMLQDPSMSPEFRSIVSRWHGMITGVVPLVAPPLSIGTRAEPVVEEEEQPQP